MYIKGKVDNIVKKYGTRNPYEIAHALDVILIEVPLIGVNGFYQYYKRNHIIYINEDLNDIDKRIVLAHELGHLFLHPSTNTIYLNTYTELVTQRYEIEADTFASELLISDEMLEEYNYYTIDKVASVLDVYPKHVKYKLDRYNKIHNKKITKTI